MSFTAANGRVEHLPAGTRVHVISDRQTGTYTATVSGTDLTRRVRIGDFKHA